MLSNKYYITHKYYFFVIIIYFSLIMGVKAQNLFFEKISGEGITSPVTSIHGIAKDTIGYMWFGSWNGVYRYDGEIFDFYNHNPMDNTSIPNNRIRNIISDKKHGLWFLTFDLKYAKYNYALNNFKVVDIESVHGDIVAKLNKNSNALSLHKNIKQKQYYLASHIFTEEALDSGKTYQYLADINQPGALLDDYITSFYIDNQDIIWLGSRGGDVYKANTNRNPFKLSYNYISKNNKAKLVSTRDILKVGDDIWVGTDEGILIYDKNGFNKNHPFYTLNNKTPYVRTLFLDDRQGVWIGAVGGLQYYNLKTNKIQKIISQSIYPNLSTRSVFAIESSEKDVVWVGLYNGIAKVSIENNNLVYFDLSKEIGDHSVMDILVVNKNELWLGVEGNGVLRLEFSERGRIINKESIRTKYSNLSQNIFGDMVYAMHEDKLGNIWVGTSDGLSKITRRNNENHIEKVKLTSDKSNAYISAITGDKNGNIWVAHKHGISVIEVDSNKIINYDIKDRVSSWIFLERAIYKDVESGKIYFGAKKGYVSFLPEDIKKVFSSSKLVLKSLFLANEKVLPAKSKKEKSILTKSLEQTKSIALEYQNRDFAIEVALLNYDNTSIGKFEYKLEGFEDSWNKGVGKLITYNKLPPGDYVFKARSLTPKGNVRPVVVLNVNIGSPWYATTYAFVLYVLILFGVLYVVYKEIISRERLKNEVKLERSNAEKHEELNREKLEFFTNVSHELKTPLTLISGPLQQLQKGRLKKENRDVYFSMVNRNVNHLARLINQILDFQKSENGKLKLNSSSWDFNILVKGCYNSFKFIAAKRDIVFNVQQGMFPLYCYLDLEKVEQIIMNVLSNAFKYTPNNGKVELSVGLDFENTCIRIKIEDNGVGIDSKSFKKIFKPFNNVGSRPFQGNSSGIGLSLTKNLIYLLNGSITVNSVPDKGTKVIIKLPYVKGVEETTVEIKKKHLHDDYREKEIPKSVKVKPTILIVEDNSDVQTFLNKELKNQYSLIQEYDGKKGLESAINNIPDLIISDIMMPIMEGVNMCKKLKINETTCHIPVILLTAKDSDENHIEGYTFGAESYITKPFNIAVLKAQLKSVLENRLILEKKRSKIKSINKLQKEALDLDSVFLKKITAIIEKEMGEVNFNAEELAQIMKISQRQLYRKLRAVSGSTVHEFIIRVKMDQAERLLINSNLNISQIAYKTGFSEPSNFSRTFSKYFGSSPSKYLKEKTSVK